MKILLVISILLLAGCAPRVYVTVNSVRTSDAMEKRQLMFPKIDSSIESEKIRRECIKGAMAANFEVANTCSGTCYWVVASGKTGDTKGSLNSFYNSYTKQVQYSTSNETSRQMKISVFNDETMTDQAWASSLDSSGSTNNVMGVAAEMCEAGFKAFPREVTNGKFEIASQPK